MRKVFALSVCADQEGFLPLCLQVVWLLLVKLDEKQRIITNGVDDGLVPKALEVIHLYFERYVTHYLFLASSDGVVL